MASEWVPSDDWLASWVRHLRGLPPGADVRAWVPVLRAELAAEVAERRERRRRDAEEAEAEEEAVAATVRRRRRAAAAEAVVREPRRRRGGTSPADVLRDLLAGPEGQFLVALLLEVPAVLEGAATAFRSLAQERAREHGVLWRRSTRHAAAPAVRYLASKVGLPSDWQPPAPSWGRGERPTASQVAACNAVTPRQAREWVYRLTGGEAERRAALAELHEVGGLATAAAAPLALWVPESGPPRGLWPDPPPPEDVPEASEAVRAGAKPAFVGTP